MRIVEVHPGKKAFALSGSAALPNPQSIDPLHRLGDRLVAGALDLPQAQGLHLLEVEIVEIVLEPLGDAPLVVEHVGRDEAAGAETGRREGLGQRLAVVREPVAAVVAHSVGGRQESGHERRVRRQGERGHRSRVQEVRAGRRQLIENRSLRRRSAERSSIDADAVGARRVEGHQQNVELVAPNAGGEVAERLVGRDTGGGRDIRRIARAAAAEAAEAAERRRQTAGPAERDPNRRSPSIGPSQSAHGAHPTKSPERSLAPLSAGVFGAIVPAK